MRRMKATIAAILAIAMSMGMLASAQIEWSKLDVVRNTITVVVDGTTLAADNFLYNDTTYVAIRAAAEAMGREVRYDGETETAYIGGAAIQPVQPAATAAAAAKPDGGEIPWERVDVVANTMTVVVEDKTLAADNFLYNDTTYVPIRAVAEAMGREVRYDSVTNTAYIDKPAAEEMPTAEPSAMPEPSASPAVPSTSATASPSATAEPEELDIALKDIPYYQVWTWTPSYTNYVKSAQLEEDEGEPEKQYDELGLPAVQPSDKEQANVPYAGIATYRYAYDAQKLAKYEQLLVYLEYEKHEQDGAVLYEKDDKRIELSQPEDGVLQLRCGRKVQFERTLPARDIVTEVSLTETKKRAEYKDSPYEGSIYTYIDDAGNEYVQLEEIQKRMKYDSIGSQEYGPYEIKVSLEDEKKWRLVKTDARKSSREYLAEGPLYRDAEGRYFMHIEDFRDMIYFKSHLDPYADLYE